MLDELQRTAAPGSVLVLDSGNALFANAGVATDADKKRAAFVFQVMEDLGTRVMAVGQRDLSAGTEFLLGLAKGKKLKLLSANLEKDGKLLFEPAAIVETGGVKVAFVGLTMPGPVVNGEPAVKATGTLDAVRKVLPTLGPRDLTVVVAAVSYADAMQLSTDLAKEVDFVIQSGEFRGTVPPQRLNDGAAVLLASGQKGQSMARLELTLGKSKDAFIDLSAVERDRQQAGFVDEQLKALDERLKLSKDKAASDQIKSTIGELKKRKGDLEASLKKKVSPDARKFNFAWTVLDSKIADEPKLKARVLEIDPAYSGSH
ncbi:MAG: 5'-nucleotidase [Myxococcaceae bacterium]